MKIIIILSGAYKTSPEVPPRSRLSRLLLFEDLLSVPEGEAKEEPLGRVTVLHADDVLRAPPVRESIGEFLARPM